MAPTKAAEGSLKRLGGGRWQTPDGRFTIEPQSGTWSLVDAEQTDDLGLPLVRGPFRSLTEAKEAIANARESGPSASPLAGRVAAPARSSKKDDGPAAKPAREGPAKAPTKAPTKAPDKDAAEPRWIGELKPDDRRRARRLIGRLEALGASDPEGVVRRDLAGGVPTIARLALAERLVEAIDRAAAKKGASTHSIATSVLDVVLDGRDDDLDVRWRVVDDDGRPIGLAAGDLDAARKRRRNDG
jgi:hypothetical protein